MDRPILRKRFVAGENLLCENVIGLGVRALVKRRGLAALEALKILTGIVEPVRVIDPQAVNFAFTQQPQNKLMGRAEDGVAFLAQGGKTVDGEKSAIVNVIGGHSPESESVGLGWALISLCKASREPETPGVPLSACTFRSINSATETDFLQRWQVCVCGFPCREAARLAARAHPDSDQADAGKPRSAFAARESFRHGLLILALARRFASQ